MVVGADIEPTEKARMVEALKAALGRLACIRPERCVDYLRALAADQDKWQHHVHHLPTSQPLDKALRSLSRKGTPPLTWYTTQARRSPAMALRAWQDGH